MQKRVLIDNNVWQFLFDSNGYGQFRTWLSSRDLAVAVAPSQAMEISLDGNANRRKGIIRLMARADVKLRPDYMIEFEPLVRLLGEKLPDVLLPVSNSIQLRFWEKIWTRDVWTGLERGNKTLVAEFRRMAAGPKSQIEALQRRQAQAFRTGSIDPLEEQFWRRESLEFLRSQLLVNRVDGTTPYAQYLSWFVDWRKLLNAWPEFVSIFQATERHDLPAFSLRQVIWGLQLSKRIGSGNAGDQQHGVFIAEVDFFVSADSGFVDILTRAVSDERMRVGLPVRVPARSVQSDKPYWLSLTEAMGEAMGA